MRIVENKNKGLISDQRDFFSENRNYERKSPYNKDIFAPFSPSRTSQLENNKSNNSS